MTGEQQKGAKDFYPALDLLRFGAAALVVLNHLRVNQFESFSHVACGSGVFKTVFFCITRIGIEAVVVFFVLSGFLVGGVSLKRARQGKLDIGRYSLDRFTRIYVPFVPALLATILIYIWLGLPFGWGEALVNLFSLQGVLAPPFSANTALWSLSYEVWFYIAAGAFLCLAFARSGIQQLAAVLPAIASVYVFATLDAAYLWVWLLGAAAYFAKDAGKLPLCLAGAPIAAAGLVLMQLTGESGEVDLAAFSWIGRSTSIVLFGFGLALLVAAASQIRANSGALRRLFRLGTWLAAFSYTLYLMHIPFIVIMEQTGWLHRLTVLDARTTGVFFMNTLLLLFFSWLFYLPFERNTQSIRQLLRRWWPGCSRSAS
ncbi:MAG: acyltransferase family protein [Sphaerospermopsis kisseleviana]